jgi:dienelactone hydrolase
MEMIKVDDKLRNVIHSLGDACSRKLKFNGFSKEDFFNWQKIAKQKLTELLSIDEFESVKPELKREVIMENEDFIKERVSYFTLKNVSVPGYLLIPKKNDFPKPAILCPPGHGGGMNQVVNETTKIVKDLSGINKQYPIELVKRGFVVLVPENIGFGERGGEKVSDQEFTTYGSNHEYFYLSLNLLGKSQLGMMVWECIKAVDVLQSLPEVKDSKIGCYGLSLGAELAILLSAIDNRIHMACASGFFSSYKTSFLSELHCGCGYSYGLFKYFDHVDLASLIIPRRLIIESGKRDKLYLIEIVRREFGKLLELYKLCGVNNNVVLDAHEGEHEISGAIAYEWFKNYLK